MGEARVRFEGKGEGEGRGVCAWQGMVEMCEEGPAEGWQGFGSGWGGRGKGQTCRRSSGGLVDQQALGERIKMQSVRALILRGGDPSRKMGGYEGGRWW